MLTPHVLGTCSEGRARLSRAKCSEPDTCSALAAEGQTACKQLTGLAVFLPEKEGIGTKGKGEEGS